jgi:glycerophosphoryl diester phosphodiesterase
MQRDEKPLNIGHRGAMGHETETPFPQSKKNFRTNVDMIEIDVF